MRYRHIAFDIDGTLTNSEFAVLQSLRETLKAVTGRAFPTQELTFALGIPGRDALERLELPDVPAALELWLRIYHEHSISIFPGIPELLAELKGRGLSLGVVTSQTREEYDLGFAPLPISRYFTTLIRVEDATGCKPSPAPLLKYMELAGCSPSELLYVGDREGDLRCARGAGVDFALAGWGNPGGQMDWTYRLEKPEDLLECL